MPHLSPTPEFDQHEAKCQRYDDQSCRPITESEQRENGLGRVE
jgi:hypothetical protein